MIEPATPPQLNVDVPSIRDVGKTKKPREDAHLPVDVVLLTVEECEFLACYMHLKNPYRCYFKELGYVYFEGEAGEQDDKVNVALLRCHAGSVGPGGSLIYIKNAVRVLTPKAVIASGICRGLNPIKTRLGDVIVSETVTKQSTRMRCYASRGFLGIIKHAADGWIPPLKDPESQNIKVHCDGYFLSGPDLLETECRRVQMGKSYPQATASETEGEGISDAAFDDQIEWLLVKGIADFAEGTESAPENWRPFASVMAASVVSHILSDPAVFRSWSHYGDSLQDISVTKAKREPSPPGSQDSKRITLEDAENEFLNETQDKLRLHYNNSQVSKVMISPCNRALTAGIDDCYVELSFLRDEIKPAGTTKKQKLEHYWKIFDSHGHCLIPTRILVHGRPGIGKSTFTKKLSVDWSRDKNEVLKKFTVLLLVNLRDVCDTLDPRSMIKESDLLAHDDTDFDRLYNYILHNQKKVLLVLDGYDEYIVKFKDEHKSSLVRQIWRGRYLRYCTVLVTTRSTRKNELTPDSHVQFELNGFDSEDKIKDYSRKFLPREDFGDFVTYLNNQKLRGFAEIPLFLLMLCLTWKNTNNQQPTSRPNLYERFILTLVGHQSVKSDEYSKNHDHPSKDDLSNLEKLAFYALLEDCLSLKLTNMPEDIRKKFVSVGLLQMSKFSSSPCCEDVAFFLHKTIQEFLSASYIIQGLKTAKEVDLTCTCLSKVDSFQKVKKMVEVLKFVCEWSLEFAIPVLKHLKIIGEKEGLRTLRFSETPSLDELSEEQKEFRIICLDFVLSCPASESDKTDVYFEFLQCVKGVLLIDPIKQLPIVARKRLMTKFANFDSPELSYIFFDEADKTTSDDLFSMLFELHTAVVTCYGDTKEVEEYTDLKEYVNDYFLKKEAQQLILYLTNIRKVSKVLRNIELLRVLTSETLPPDQNLLDPDSENTGHQEKKHSLSFVRHFVLWGATAEELRIGKCVLSFANKPQLIDIPQLPEGCDDLIQSIPFTDNLYSLKLKLNDDAVAGIAKSLHQAPELRSLNLSGDFLHGSVSDLIENLQCLTQLTQLKFPSSNLIDEDCRVLAKSLQYLCCLKELNLSENCLGRGIRELAKHLAGVPRLTHLELRDTQMGKEEVTAVACSLKNISELRVLNLSSNPLCEGIIELSKHLRRVPNLKTLVMKHTQMGEKEVKAVARVLNGLPALKLLNLSWNNALGRGVSELTQYLSRIPCGQLGEIRLEGIQITEKDACKLFEVAQDRGFDVFLDGHNPQHQSQTSRSAEGRNRHPRTNNWQARDGEKVLECVNKECCAVVYGLEHIADVFPDDPERKTYIFYYFSQAEEDGVNMEPERENQSFQEGTPLIPMLRREGYKHMCVVCFEKHFPVVLSGIRDSLQGRANFVNPDKTLHLVS